MTRAAPLFVVALTLAACGDLSNVGSGGPPPAPSDLAKRVERVAPLLEFQALVPDTSPPMPLESVTLFARQTPPTAQPDERGVLGEPILWVQWSVVAGGKPALLLVEGPPDCCGAALPGGARTPIVVHSGGPGGLGEVRGELVAARGVNEGTALWWNQPTASGRTYVALMSTSFAPLDEAALLAMARSLRAVNRRGPTDLVLLYLSTHESHSPAGHRVYLGAKSAPVPDEARLVDTAGKVVVSSRFDPPKPHECLRAAAAVASLPTSVDLVRDLRPGASARAVRAEARFGGLWRPVELIASGCFSIE